MFAPATVLSHHQQEHALLLLLLSQQKFLFEKMYFHKWSLLQRRSCSFHCHLYSQQISGRRQLLMLTLLRLLLSLYLQQSFDSDHDS
jgi:hypothetical protein